MATYDGAIDDRIEHKFIILHHKYRVALEAIRDREWIENTLDPQLAISTYQREAGFKIEPHKMNSMTSKPMQRQVGPWVPIPVVQAESEEK